jgi:thiol-disulfide isomerase/thioredoxin
VQARWWRINELAMKGSDSARVALALAERFWAGAGRGDRVGAMVGFQIARMAEDTGDARVRWADRKVAATPASADGAYSEIGRERALRPAAIQRLEALAARLLVPDDGRRALESSRAQAAATDSARARWVFAMLGGLHLDAGDSAAARDAFSRATTGGWDLGLFRRAASALFTLGDTSRALAVAARIAADPGTPPSSADSLARRAHAIIGESRWRSLVAESRQAMRAHFLGAATRSVLPREIALVDAANRPTTLQQLTRGRVSVVTFWSRNCAPSRQAMSQLAALGARLTEHGMALVPITGEPPTQDVATFLTQNPPKVPVYFDTSNAARQAFGQWGTPEYYVLDARGVVRFEHSTIDLVLAQAVSLAEE